MTIKSLILKKIKEKKNIFFFLILFVLFLIIFISLTMVHFVIDFKKDTYTKNILTRTLWVDSKNGEEKDFEAINNIEHVVLNKSTKYLNSIVENIPEFDKEDLKGKIEIYALMDKLDLKITNGRTIENEEEMICPEKFYPHDMYVQNTATKELKLKIFDTHILNGKDVIGKELNLYSVNPEKDVQAENIKVKIVGTYNTFDTLNALNTCYISQESYDKIASPYSSYTESIDINNVFHREYNEYTGRMIRVDSYENVDSVSKKIKELGFSVNLAYHLDEAYLQLILYVPFLIAIIVIIVSSALIYNFMNKKIRSKRNYLGIMSVLGYEKRKLEKLEIIENIIISCLVFALSFISYLLIYSIITNNFLDEFSYNSVTVRIPIISFIAFLLIFILMLSMMIKGIMERNFKYSITTMLKKD